MKTVNWGIIGPGKIARQFAHDVQFTSHGTLHAVASRSESRAAEFASDFKIPTHYGNYDELSADPAVDAVYIATPHNFHFDPSAAALSAGKAVLSEKPLTHSLEQTKQLIEISQSTGSYLMEGMWTWFLPAVQKAKEWYEQGRIGALRHIQASFGFPLPYDPEHRGYNPDLAGGALLDIGIYTLAITRFFTDAEPQDMKILAHKAPTGVDDEVNILLDYGDLSASLTCSFRVKLPNNAYIFGDKGTLQLPDFWRATECFLDEDEKRADHFNDNRKGLGFEFEIEAVSKEILAGNKIPKVVDHSNSLWLARMMEQILLEI